MRRILSGIFWLTGCLLVIYGVRQGSAGLFIPVAVAAILLAFAADLYFHRSLVAFDRELLRTGLNLASAAAVAAGSMYWAWTFFN